MNKQNNEATQDEKQIDPCVSKLDGVFKQRQSVILIEMPHDMINQYSRRGQTPARLNPAQSC